MITSSANTPRVSHAAVVLVLGIQSAWAVDCGQVPPVAPFDAKQLSGHARILASDEFEGRSPADQWTPAWNLQGVALDLTVMYRAGKELVNSSAWPQWSEGSEFKRTREDSAGARLSR